ncbi:hypothetical protein BDZ94DRAFT_1235040 [Collybia nuda]|uniref:Uncharacterized protein n=1 Tax=Collybia nuda TaxID=64659 RepID=A0A9P6CLK3_9AGAR|nr:hypothetical protein BDZ94DRAFT_1235040 [Collybia nuda]
MDGDSSDILGNPNTIVRAGQASKWSGLSFGIKSTFILALLLVVYVVGIKAWGALLLWREKSYKLSMRRRHGIPDNDHRPFNVAYAAVMRARQDAEVSKRKARLDQIVLLGQEQRNAPLNQTIRQRPGSQRGAQSAWPIGVTNDLPGRFNLSSDGFYAPISGSSQTQTRSHSAAVRPIDFAERYNPDSTGRVSQADINNSPPRAGPSRRSSRRNIFVSDVKSQKRELDGDESEDGDHSKKSRVEGEEFIDEDAEWQEGPEVNRRGSKRVLRDEDNEDPSHSKQPRDKRARKVSLEKVPQTVIEDMDIDDDEDEDQVTELRASSSRGKKRDRAAAGSTFGGDDEDSAHEAELEDEARARRQRRKRRTVAKRKSDAGNSSRGQKRDRDVEEGESDGESEGGITSKVSRKKRGKKIVRPSRQDDEEIRSGSDVSMNESLASSRGRGRRIGDEWESNGVKFKIGPNGQRLRQALVKKARQKFNMPKDSQHPDRQLNLEVCVETWLTEEEYREAKSQLLLAWQDSPKHSAEPETPTVDTQDVPPPQPPTGKNLLWTSTSTTPASPSFYLPSQTPPGTPKSKNRDQYRQSIATNVGLRINPFHQQQIHTGKRIASAVRVASAFTDRGVHPSSPGSPGLSDSTNGISRVGPRAFSKWEKQDLEAKAMMKLREANRKKEAEREQKLKEEKEKADKEQKEKEAATTKQTIPTITLTKPVESKPIQSEIKPLSLSFAPPLGSSVTSTNDATSKPLFGPPASTPAAPFTLPPMAAPAPSKLEDKISTKPSFPTQPPPPPANSAFSFNNSSAAPQQPASSLGTNPSKDIKAGEQPKAQTSFSFGPPPTNTTAPAKPPPAPFSWNTSSAPTAQLVGGVEKTTASSASSGSSLLSRLAPVGNVVPPATQPQQNGPMFSFKSTATEPNKPSSVFGTPAQNTTPQPAPTSIPADAAPAAGASSLKFNFGVKPAAVAPSPTPASSTSSLSGALGGDSVKPAPNPFGFKAPTEGGTTATNGTTTPKFSFGTAPATANSPFGASTSGFKLPPSTTPQTSDAAPKPAFSGFGGGSQPLSAAFGTAPQGTPAPVFSSGTTNVFGSSGTSVFGGSANSSEAPKSTSVFASNSTTSASGDTPKSVFSFGNTTTPAVVPPPTPAPATSPFSFKFGETAKSTETPQASQPATGQSMFGKPSGGPSAFGFGASTGGFGFGNPPTSAAQQQQ